MATSVLVIDDDDLLRDAISALLEAEGYAVRVAENGDAGIALFEQERPDIVVTDIVMPDRDGIDTIVSLKRDHPEVPVIAISGGGQIDSLSYLRMAQTLGADRVLEKPFRLQSLLDALAELTSGAGSA